MALSRWYSSLRSRPRATTQSCHAKAREYLQLTVTDSTTYGNITEAILSYDAACKVLKSLTQGAERRWTYTETWKLTESTWTKERQGERKVQRKRKGGEWTSAWGYLRGKGRGRGLKGKGKDRGKPKGKRGKSKRKNKGKGKLGQNQCSDHLQSGHGARDCPNKMRVEQSDQGQQQQQPSQDEMLNHSFLEDEADHAVRTAASSSNSRLRRVFNIGMPSLSFGCMASGSDVSLLPKRHQRNLDESTWVAELSR